MQSVSSYFNGFFIPKIIHCMNKQLPCNGNFKAVISPNYVASNIDQIIVLKNDDNSFIDVNGQQLMCF